MNDIFKTIVGFLFLLALVQVIRSMIQTHVPVFEFLDASLIGVVFVVGILGVTIIFMSGAKLLLSPVSRER